MKISLYNSLKILYFLALSSVGFSQTGILKGRVYDRLSNESLPFVNVIISGSTNGTVTDDQGNFTLKDLSPGFIKLSVSFIGYKPVLTTEVQVVNAETEYIDIPMDQADVKLKEVTITANAFQRTVESPLSLHSIGISEIENNPGSNRDISKVIQTFPGVGSTPSYRNDIIIRGGGPSESRYYLDGVEIPNLNHFATQGSSGGSVGVINTDFISSVNYYSSSFPANRGNALSGIFEFTQIDGNKDKLQLTAVAGSSDLALTLNTPVGKKSTMIFSARQSYLQFLFSALGLPFLPTYNDFQLKSRTRLNEKNEITIIGLGAIDRSVLNTGIKNPTEIQQFILSYLPTYKQWNYALGAVYKHYNKHSYHTFVLSRNMLNNTSFKFRNNDNSSDANKILDYQSQEMENKLRYEFNDRYMGMKVTLGLGGEFDKYNNNTFQQAFLAGALKNINYGSNLELFRWNLFGQLSRSFYNERLALSLGIRSDANNYSPGMSNIFDQLSPRFSASYNLVPKINLNFSTGRFYQLPAYTTLGFRDNNGILVNKNNNLKYISVNHIVSGIEYNPYKNIQLTIEGFYKTYQNYPFSLRDSISLANKGADFGVVGDEAVVSKSKGRAAGFEILNRYKLDNGLIAIISYTYVRSRFEDKSGNFVPSSWDVKHLLTLTSTKLLGHNWNIGLKWRFIGGLPYTPYDINKSSLVNAWNTQGRAFLNLGKINSERLKAYHQLDLRIDKKYYFKKWSLMLYLDIQNAYGYNADQPADLVRVTNNLGDPVIANPNDPIDQQRYELKYLQGSAATILPSIGIMIKF